MEPKIHSRMHLIELYFLKIFSEEHNFKPPSNKTEQHYMHHTITQAEMYYKTTPLSQKYTPMFEHEF